MTRNAWKKSGGGSVLLSGNGETMTPHAHHLLRIFEKPRWRERGLYDDTCGLFEGIVGCHCFEITEAMPILKEIAEKLFDTTRDHGLEAIRPLVDGLLFLPAEKTWLEWRDDKTGARIAIFLVQSDGEWANVFVAGHHRSEQIARLNTSGSASLLGGEKKRVAMLDFVKAALVAINSPKIIDRTEHHANAGLERRLAATHGKGFRLRDWTQIRLRIFKPDHIDDGQPHAAIISGRRALHFCRAHLRTRLGRLEYVTSHWRGDPERGVRSASYRVSS